MHSLPTLQMENAQHHAPVALRPQKNSLVPREHEASCVPYCSVWTLWRKEKLDEG
jgi:hypothetical protein